MFSVLWQGKIMLLYSASVCGLRWCFVLHFKYLCNNFSVACKLFPKYFLELLNLPMMCRDSVLLLPLPAAGKIFLPLPRFPFLRFTIHLLLLERDFKSLPKKQPLFLSSLRVMFFFFYPDLYIWSQIQLNSDTNTWRKTPPDVKEFVFD